jgi:hypothetical protein
VDDALLRLSPLADEQLTQVLRAAGEMNAPASRVTGRELAELRREFDEIAKPAFWRSYAEQID